MKVSHIRFRRVAVAAVLLTCLPISVHAAEESWSSHGPDGGSVNAIAVDPVTPSNVYAATRSNGLFKSTDGGSTWASVAANEYLDLVQIDDLVVDPHDPSTLYAAIPPRIYKSTDGGVTWGPSSDLTSGSDRLAIDPVTPDVVYTFDFGFTSLYKSSDGGGSWVDLGDNFPSRLSVYSLLPDPSNPSTLYAGVLRHETGDSGVYKSIDGGFTWTTPDDFLPPGQIRALAVDSSDPSIVYAGGLAAVYKSQDGGVSWMALETSPSIVNSLLVDPTNPSVLLAATFSDGIFRSSDGGSTWSPVAAPFEVLSAGELAFDPLDPTRVYAGVSLGEDAGMIRSDDGGLTWSPVNQGLHALRIRSLATDPSRPEWVYAGTENGVFSSRDSGVTWARAGRVVTDDPDVFQLLGTVRAVVVEPGNPSTAYAAMAPFVYKSSDGGVTWRAVLDANARVTALAIDPQDPLTIFAGDVNRVLRSVDGGATWTSHFPHFSLSEIASFAVHPVDGSTVYTCGFDGLAKSTDGGETWFEIGESLSAFDCRRLAIDPQKPSTIYAAFRSGGILTSDDDGITWVEINEGLPTTPRRAYDVVVDPDQPQTLYAASVGEGVFRSTDGGASWTPLADGLPRGFADVLAIGGGSAVLYAAGVSV